MAAANLTSNPVIRLTSAWTLLSVNSRRQKYPGKPLILKGRVMIRGSATDNGTDVTIRSGVLGLLATAACLTISAVCADVKKNAAVLTRSVCGGGCMFP